MHIELYGLAEYCSISRIVRLPEAVTKDRSRGAAATPVVGSGQRSPNRRPDAECAEEIAANPQAVDEPALAARRQVEPVPIPCKRAGEDVLPVTQGLPDEVRDGAGFANSQLQQFLRMLDRQILQHDRVDEAENRRVGADAQRQ